MKMFILFAAFATASVFAETPSRSLEAGSVYKQITAKTVAPGQSLFAFDIEERVRGEYRENNFDFDDGADAITDDVFLMQRLRLGVKSRATSWLHFYAQAQSAIEISNRPNDPGMAAAEGDDPIDLHQAWIELGNYESFPLGLRIGRQIFNYGDQRLVGGFDWNNLGRVFDAIRLRYETVPFWVEMYAASVVIPERSQFNRSDLFDANDTGRNQLFSGIYASTTALPNHTIDVYSLVLNQSNSNAANSAPLLALPPAGTSAKDASGRTDFVTLGTHIKRTPPKNGVGFDYDGEFAFQTGKVGGLNLRAMAVHVGAGHTMDTAWHPRIGVEYNYASGDSDSRDGRSTTFQNLFPTNHKFYGEMDLFAWQNIHNAAVTLSLTPVDKISIVAGFHLFWLATTDDAWYRANGLTRVRPVTPSANSYLGSEFDVRVSWKTADRLSLQTGYSHFFPGAYVEDTGAADSADFVYLQAEWEF